MPSKHGGASTRVVELVHVASLLGCRVSRQAWCCEGCLLFVQFRSHLSSLKKPVKEQRDIGWAVKGNFKQVFDQ